MTMITIGVSDTFKTFEYVFNLDENTTIEQLKGILAQTLKCKTEHILLSYNTDDLDNTRALNTLWAATEQRPERLSISVKSIIPGARASAAGVAAATRPSVESEEQSLTPAMVLWVNWMQSRREALFPLQNIQAYKTNLDPLGGPVAPELSEDEAQYAPSKIFNPDYPAPTGIDIVHSKGIPTAISMPDFEQCVSEAIEYPSAHRPFDIAALKQAWGLENKLYLRLEEFCHLMELHSKPQSHLIFDAAVRAAFIAAKQPFAGELHQNPIARMQHVTQALRMLATDIFADAVNSSMAEGISGAWAGFLPRLSQRKALLADGRIGAYSLCLSYSEPCKLDILYLSIPATQTAGSAPMPIHQPIELVSIAAYVVKYKFGNSIYPSLTALIQNNKALFKHPCLVSSLSTHLGSLESAQIAAPRAELPLWVSYDTLMHSGAGAINPTCFNHQYMVKIVYAIQQAHLIKNNTADRAYLSTFIPSTAAYFDSKKTGLQKYHFNGFHSMATYEQLTARLLDTPRGTFILRISQSEPKSMILGFQDANNKVQQCIFKPTDHHQVLCSGILFPSLESIIIAYRTPSQPTRENRSPHALLKMEKEPYPLARDSAVLVAWLRLALPVSCVPISASIIEATDTDSDPSVPGILTNASLIKPTSTLSQPIVSPDLFTGLGQSVYQCLFLERKPKLEAIHSRLGLGGSLVPPYAPPSTAPMVPTGPAVVHLISAAGRPSSCEPCTPSLAASLAVCSPATTPLTQRPHGLDRTTSFFAHTTHAAPTATAAGIPRPSNPSDALY